MQHLCAVLLAAVIAQGALACPHDLRGTWKSDRELSLAFARDNARLQPKTEAFLASLYGHMTLTFGRRELHVAMPDIEVPVSGESKPFAGFEHRAPYKVLFCNSTTVAWSSTVPFAREPKATTALFLDANTFWVYSGTTDPKVPDLHSREYFRRIE
jgi:hypothetical protein